MKLETIDIIAKQWCDRINGITYFSARVFINFGGVDEQTIYLPFQAGYSTAHYHEAIIQLVNLDIIEDKKYPRTWLSDNNVIVNDSIEYKCLKRDVKSWGKE